MIQREHPPTASTISGVSFDGLTITAPDGKPARLAVIDEAGNIIEAGESISAAVWNVAIECHRQFLIGLGHLKIHSEPTGVRGKAA